MIIFTHKNQEINNKLFLKNGEVPTCKTNEHHLLAWNIDCQQQRDEINKILLDMAVILEIKNSSRKVEIEDYREFCMSTALLVKSEPWIKLHQLPCCASPQP